MNKDINWRLNKNELPHIAYRDEFDIRSELLLINIDKWGSRTGHYLCHKGEKQGLWQLTGVHGDFPDSDHTVHFAYINAPEN